MQMLRRIPKTPGSSIARGSEQNVLPKSISDTVRSHARRDAEWRWLSLEGACAKNAPQIGQRITTH
jgi:hypothetical protein